MATSVKRSTVYLDARLHKALRLKSVETARSMSDLINDAVKESLSEDAEDLAAFQQRRGEPLLAFEDMLKELKADGVL
jgi:hypothetical protein